MSLGDLESMFIKAGDSATKEGLCVLVGFLRDFGILMKTLSHYSQVCITFE